MNYNEMTVSVDWTQTTEKEQIEFLIKRQMVLNDLVTNMLLTFGEHMLKGNKND